MARLIRFIVTSPNSSTPTMFAYATSVCTETEHKLSEQFSASATRNAKLTAMRAYQSSKCDGPHLDLDDVRGTTTFVPSFYQMITNQYERGTHLFGHRVSAFDSFIVFVAFFSLGSDADALFIVLWFEYAGPTLPLTHYSAYRYSSLAARILGVILFDVRSFTYAD
ncbi:hypothetical protein B0H12DRAFT_372901 [Mycena haematopus]|nr:hypothetical protein B0H12DRAFT_372901 [Mycena haematopus]